MAGSGTKCDTMALTVLNVVLSWYKHSLLWPSFHDHHMHFQVVCSSICLKDPQIGNDNSSGTFDGQDGSLEQVAWVLATQRQELSVNNEQLFIETYRVTIIYLIFL